MRGKTERAKSRQQGFESNEQQLKRTINVENVQKEYLLGTRDNSKMIRHSQEPRNDEDEGWSRDGTSTGNRGEEDNISAADSSDDEEVHCPHVVDRNNTSTVNRNNTSTPQNSGGTTYNNRLQAALPALPRGNGLPTTHEMMAAWELVQQQQEHAQHNEDNYGDNNGRTNAAGKRALSYRVAKQLQKKHVNTRIQGLVKTVIFRKCKFVTSEAHYNRVMAVVIDSEKPDDPGKFVRLYKTCVLGSLNSKRSSCQQAAADCVKALLKEKQHRTDVDPPPYSVDMLCKLRQSQTPEEKEAFLWFANSLLECVCGKIAWGSKKKYRSRISDAKYDNTNESIVTVSDEAFALLIYENYIDKWITRYHNPPPPGVKGSKIMGKYTRCSIGYSEYGGWSEEGVLRFNELCSIVVEDRSSRNAMDSEEWVMLTMRQQKYGEPAQNNTENTDDENRIQDSESSLERNALVVNAFIEL